MIIGQTHIIWHFYLVIVIGLSIYSGGKYTDIRRSHEFIHSNLMPDENFFKVKYEIV